MGALRRFLPRQCDRHAKCLSGECGTTISASWYNVSTPSIYFDYLDQHKVPETFISRHFVNDYAYTKFLAEQEVAAATDLSSVIIRPRGIFGEYDTAVLPRLLKISEKGFLPLIRRSGREAGGALVDVTYVGKRRPCPSVGS